MLLAAPGSVGIGLDISEASLANSARLLSFRDIFSLSTAIRLESVDHVPLFQTQGEVRGLLGAAGRIVIAGEVIPLAKLDIRDQAVRDELIANPRTAVGYVALLSSRAEETSRLVASRHQLDAMGLARGRLPEPRGLRPPGG